MERRNDGEEEGTSEQREFSLFDGCESATSCDGLQQRACGRTFFASSSGHALEKERPHALSFANAPFLRRALAQKGGKRNRGGSAAEGREREE